MPKNKKPDVPPFSKPSSSNLSSNDSYEPTDEEEELLEEVQEFDRYAEEWQDRIYEKFMRFYYLYRGLQMEEEYPWRNNLSLPIAFSTIETLIPRVIKNQPKISLKALSTKGSKNLKESRAILNYDYFDRDMQLNLIPWFKRCFIYGTSVLKVQFKKEQVPVPKKNLLGRIKRFFRNDNELKEKQYIETTPVSPFHFKVDDPQVEYIRDANIVSHTVYKKLSDLKKNKKYYKNLKYVDEEPVRDDYASIKWNVNQKNHQKRGRILEESIPGVDSSQSFQRQELVKITEYYFKSDEDNPRGRLVTVANDEIIIRNDENPYWYIDGEFPFIDIKDQPVPGEFYGIGEIEPIESLIYEENHMRSRRLDSSEQSADKMWWVNDNSDIDENELVWRPSGIVHGVAGEDFGVIEQGEIATTSFKEEQLVKQDIASTSGITQYSKGMPQKYETATGMTSLINEANQRFALKIQLIGEMGLARLCKMILQMETFEASGTRMGKILGEDEEYMEVNAEDISKDYDIAVTIDPFPLINKKIKIEQLNQVLQTMGSIDAPGIKMVIKRLLVTLSEGEISEEQIEEAIGESNVGLKEQEQEQKVEELPKRRTSSGRKAEAKASISGGQKTAKQSQPEANAGTSLFNLPRKK